MGLQIGGERALKNLLKARRPGELYMCVCEYGHVQRSGGPFSRLVVVVEPGLRNLANPGYLFTEPEPKSSPALQGLSVNRYEAGSGLGGF